MIVKVLIKLMKFKKLFLKTLNFKERKKFNMKKNQHITNNNNKENNEISNQSDKLNLIL